ncbi:MAG TPA: nucleotidyl transferase AbiEii/AbiGii toxin family protein [Gaiellaceae bacterium]|nr:nucleotidyl transferase AbiEii/AbiGii toxin family protein [Gaiellaceae bacterium]
MANISAMQALDEQNTHELLAALGEQLAQRETRIELVVIGGSALLALGLIHRTTRDVDVVGLLTPGGVTDPRPLPEAVLEAADRVSADFDLPADWLNAAPASLLDFGLPAGFIERLASRDYGPALRVHFASRIDQIHFKLYAMVDQGPGKHEADLVELTPTADELLTAARWARTHDPSDAFRQELISALSYLGVKDGTRDL